MLRLKGIWLCKISFYQGFVFEEKQILKIGHQQGIYTFKGTVSVISSDPPKRGMPDFQWYPHKHDQVWIGK